MRTQKFLGDHKCDPFNKHKRIRRPALVKLRDLSKELRKELGIKLKKKKK